jgi:hypothetical protein
MEYADLVNLTFGRSTAESEAEKLDEYFISTQAYINAKNEERRKIYYVGHRGAGKSALLNKLAHEFQNDGNSIILKMTPHDFSYELFRKREHDYVEVRSVYAAVWHYTLVIQLLKRIVNYFNERPHLKANRDNVIKLKKYLITKGFYEADSILEVFFSFLREATVIKVANKLQNIETASYRGDKQLFRFLNLSEISSELNALENITDTHPIYLFIDELDTGWDNTKEAQNFIYGLFYAVREIRKLRNVTAFVSLRSDMYNDLSSILPDPEKMRDDIERFTWNEKTLRWLIGRRITVYSRNKELERCSPEEAISNVFEKGVLSYIISHSLHRPREIIQFCNEALDELRSLIYSETRPTKVNMDVVNSVAPTFSRNRFYDLCEEYKHQYPGLETLLSCFEHAPEYYLLDEFKSKLEEAMLKTVEKIGGDSWIQDYLDTPMKLIEILFEIGFIKLYSQKDQKYLAYYETTFLSLDNIPQLKIHDVFVSALKCKC